MYASKRPQGFANCFYILAEDSAGDGDAGSGVELLGSSSQEFIDSLGYMYLTTESLLWVSLDPSEHVEISQGTILYAQNPMSLHISLLVRLQSGRR